MRSARTTFSRDQIDLNYRNEQVFLRILEVLLPYVRRGSNIIRMDAATYLWVELGTSFCGSNWAQVALTWRELMP